MNASDLVGSGWAFPVGVTGGGGIRLVQGPADIDSAITLILSTAPGERLMRPDFGCAIWDQVFSPLNENTLGLLEQSVREALVRWEPRIELERVTATGESREGQAILEIHYRVRATNDTRNLVYPFYTIPRETRPEEARP